jgi:uncharacterized protein (TIGR00299 family) protein
MPDSRHIHLDVAGGIAGDMFVAALLDALPELKPRVFADLAAVLPADCGQPRLSAGVSGGVACCRFALVTGEETPAHTGHEHHEQHGHHHHEAHDHDHSGHAHDEHPHGHSHDHAVHFPEIVALIASARLHPGTAERAIAILHRLAEAEAKMHRVSIDAVHFHEIADWDSLMDVVAAGSIAAALAASTWSVSDLPRGSGLVRTRHGLLPIPAPATAEILRGFRWRDDGVGGERVTPTGAAIVAELVRDIDRCPAGRLRASGSGAGTRELPGMPNILRALVFDENRSENATAQESVVVCSFDVDDMSGEEVAVAADRLRAVDGVIDLTLAVLQGKKGRPVSAFRLLVKPSAFAAVSAKCFLETTTIGLRWRTEQRLCLPRGAEVVEVDGQRLRRKRTQRPGGFSSLKVESDDLAAGEGLAARRRLQRLGEGEDS